MLTSQAPSSICGALQYFAGDGFKSNLMQAARFRTRMARWSQGTCRRGASSPSSTPNPPRRGFTWSRNGLSGRAKFRRQHKRAFAYTRHIYDRQRYERLGELAVFELLGAEWDAFAWHRDQDVGFFDVEKLPELSVSRVLGYQIERMLAHANAPDLPTEFD